MVFTSIFQLQGVNWVRKHFIRIQKYSKELDPQRQLESKTGKHKEFERLCWLYCPQLYLHLSCYRLALSVVLFRSTCPPETGWQPSAPFQSPRGKQFSSQPGSDVLSGPVIHGWWCVYALGDNMGGPPHPCGWLRTFQKKGSSLHRGDRKYLPHTHSINILLWVYSLTPLWGEYLWLQENLDIGPRKPWARLWIRIMNCSEFSKVTTFHEAS